MHSRIAEHNRIYRRTMAVCLPIALLAVLGVGARFPVHRFPEWQDKPRVAAQPGPLHILPQLDIVDEIAEEQTTAAIRLIQSADFVTLDIEYVDRPSEKVVPVPRPRNEIVIPDPEVNWTEDDLQTEIHTTGMPVLARTEIEVLHFQRPLYPDSAIDLGIEGVVEIMLLVGEDGAVRQAYVIQPGRLPMLERSAVQGLRAALFKPFRVNGDATSFWVRWPVDFRLVE